MKTSLMSKPTDSLTIFNLESGYATDKTLPDLFLR